ncbi:S9 family peptidase [Fulvivirga sp. RKSG066]|uniref:alpha/beta hydrolase family protein n=1 Tax=Fulvivirga aurantia TaxID=2529383 RepID=UPI0012BB79DF|nr:prolyl oligopeptidase family serine peptidase [Fulvivirga aurantia]MTI21957.1 S9 family peptidase [Fulvivirga aurantia]
MKKLFFLSLSLLIGFSTWAQKRALQHEDFDTWKRITNESISPNGNFVAFHLTPGKGDQILKIKRHSGEELLSYKRGESSRFSADSKYLIFKIVPALDSVNALRRLKTKDDRMPKDTLAIFDLEAGSLTKIPALKQFMVPKKWSNYVFYQLEEIKAEKDTTNSDSTAAKKPKKEKKVGKETGYHLVIRNLESQQQDTIPFVTDYSLAKEGERLLYSTSGKDSTFLQGVYYLDLSTNTTRALHQSKGKFKHLSLDKSGEQAAFITDVDTTKALIRNFQLRYWKDGLDSAVVKADTSSTFLVDNWGVSEHANLMFSDNQEKLYFGTAPIPLAKDTSLLSEEIIQVEIWNYKNQRLHTQQNAELEEDQKKSYQAVFYPKQDKLVQLGTPEVPEINLADKGNAKHSLGLSYEGYQQYISWEGFPRHMDVYLINNETGERQLVKQNLRGSADISADGNYLYWVNAVDTTWTSYAIDKKKSFNLSEEIDVSLADELFDQPNLPSSYGAAGWTEDDKHFLIYDRYDIWKLDPENKEKPEKITDGRNSKTRHRYVHLDPEEESINPDFLLIHTFNENSRNEGFASLNLKRNKLQNLITGQYAFSKPTKAENTEQIFYTKESHTLFPDLLASDLSFKFTNKLSNANPEIDNYLWSSVEVYKWTSLDGKPLEGLLYKPENFDPNKKYPMITYFYERNSHNLNRHWGAVPIRSIINPAFYASRGYVVFIADIVYKTGYPGESCYNAVMPGVTSLIAKGFIDKDRLGIQGHSWGGYQVAYLVTQTNMFAAAEAGAIVANMTSAYGGIRWWTGLSRMFQYEHTQSRIGGTLWEYPMRYIENSPLFYVDKINTPLLLMHNDADGHVPWYQGIEMFVAMRRLGKPAWMLNYNGEPHWPTKWENIRDFNVRMQQYFDHYLMGQPMPVWMGEGIPAIEKGITKGYKLIEE